MRVFGTQTELEAWLAGDGWRAGAGPVIVPTMGALHAGHARLVAQGARLACERGIRSGCIAWIFVNPTQFNDRADLERYPRTLDEDVLLCGAHGAAGVFAPEACEVYPPGMNIAVPDLPPVATEPGLEDAFRPGHFAGVCQVVKRFFELMRPSAAVFGEKDWQQLQVIRAMTRRERLDVEIVPAATVREADGLAMSSRNRFLGEAERKAAATLSVALATASSAPTAEAAEARMAATLVGAGVSVEYAVVRHAETLRPLAPGTRVGAVPARALVAARVGSVRLIDNCDWEAGLRPSLQVPASSNEGGSGGTGSAGVACGPTEGVRRTGRTT